MENLLSFFQRAGILKKIPRSGWLLHNIHSPESVAAHSYRTVLMVMIFAKRMGLDEAKTMKMALLHDLAESKTGDMIAERGEREVIDREEKFAKEKHAMEEILAFLSEKEKEELLNFWVEQEKGETREAKLVRDADKLEMALQAAEYQGEYPQANLEEFFVNARKHLLDPNLKKLFCLVDKKK